MCQIKNCIFSVRFPTQARLKLLHMCSSMRKNTRIVYFREASSIGRIIRDSKVFFLNMFTLRIFTSYHYFSFGIAKSYWSKLHKARKMQTLTLTFDFVFQTFQWILKGIDFGDWVATVFILSWGKFFIYPYLNFVQITNMYTLGQSGMAMRFITVYK